MIKHLPSKKHILEKSIIPMEKLCKCAPFVCASGVLVVKFIRAYVFRMEIIGMIRIDK